MWLSPEVQEGIALALVAAAAALLGARFFRAQLAPLLAQWLLRRGQVKWAMRLRFWNWQGGPKKKNGDCCH